MQRARIQYFFLLGLALALFGVAGWLTPASADQWAAGLARFVVLALAIGTSVATWGTAVLIASRHKKSWALWTSTTFVVLAGLVFAASQIRL